jgi:Na+/H+ antiporter NhaC
MLRKFSQGLLLLFLVTSVDALATTKFHIEAPDFVIMQDSASITVLQKGTEISEPWVLEVKNRQGQTQLHTVAGNSYTFSVPMDKSARLKLTAFGTERSVRIRRVPGWFSILPPLIAIALALIFKEVVLSLFAGIFIGAVAIYGFTANGILKGFFAAIEHYFFVAIGDSGNLSVIMFSVGIGGMVSIISRNGGMHGIVDKLSRFAKSARSAQLVTWFMGIAIFFDDYANTLIVGNTMRSVTDRFKVSREKLAYIVDSTAAPIAAIAFITTWIGAELGYISKASETLGIEEGAYSMFLNSLQYAYYPVFTLIFMFIILYRQKDFGPMLKAEKRSRFKGLTKNVKMRSGKPVETHEDENFKPIDISRARWYNGFFPVFTVIVVTIIGLIYTGMDLLSEELIEKDIIDINAGFAATWSNLYQLSDNGPVSFFRKIGIIIGASDAYKALLWASFSGIALAVVMTVSQRIMDVNETMSIMIEGFKAMVPAMLILILAWSLTEVTTELKTAEYITGVFKGNINPLFMPAITFLLAALVAFSTGSSWGTMAILYPLALPASWVLCQDAGMNPSESMEIFYHVIAVVLAGSVLGDHCSPISDTTIMSSLASQCYHLDHVQTQLPYAITVGLISLFISTISHFFDLPAFIYFLIGIGLILLIVRLLGKNIEQENSDIKNA